MNGIYTGVLVALAIGCSPAFAAEKKDCPFQKGLIKGNRVYTDKLAEFDELCRGLVSDFRQLEKEWDNAFTPARADFAKAKAKKDHDGSWAALKRIYLSMNLREPDLTKLTKRAADLKKLADAGMKKDPIPRMDPSAFSPDDPIVKEVNEITDEAESSRQQFNGELKKLIAFLGALEAEMKEKKGVWIGKISDPSAP